MNANTTINAAAMITPREGNLPRAFKGTRSAPIEPRKPPAEILESLWLDEVRGGTDIRTIARREKQSPQLIQLGVTRARLRDLAKARGRGIDACASAADGEAARRGEFGPRPEARALPRLIPLFPIGPFTPSSTCGHRHPIRAGSVFCCMICHASGLDDHPELKRDPKTDPSPEPSQPTAPVESAGHLHRGRSPASAGTETRKQRRNRKHAGNSAAAMAS